MRVMIISSEFPPGPGGIGTHAFHISRELYSCGNSVLVVTSQDYASAAECRAFNQSQPFQIIPLEHRRFSPIEALYRAAVISRWMAKWSPDVLLATGERSTWVTALAARAGRKPWLAVGHGSEFGGKLGWQRRLTRWAFNQASGVVCVSEHTCQFMRALGVHQGNVVVIHNGADAGRFSPPVNDSPRRIFHQLGLQEPILALLTVGNVTDRKGQEVVIRAMPEVLSYCPHAHYFLAGLPTEEPKLAKIALQLGVQNHVHFLGKIDQAQLPDLYRACDVFVMTSRRLANGDFEGFGIAVIEAALCAKPAVVSRGSGLAEAVADGKTGLCVAENDPCETAEAILRLALDPQLRMQMGKNAHQRACQGFTWTIAGQVYHRIIHNLQT